MSGSPMTRKPDRNSSSSSRQSSARRRNDEGAGRSCGWYCSTFLSPCQVDSSGQMPTLHGEADYARDEGVYGINTDRACAWSFPLNLVHSSEDVLGGRR